MDIGQQIGHYTIVGRLGRGGMGEVFVAQDATLNRRVALKVLRADMVTAERLERFRREAQAVAALNHPSIVTIHSVEMVDGVHFITLELVDGKTLDSLITSGGMPIDTFFKVAIPLVDAVATAHARGIIHRDLKPSNVMVTAEGRVKVLDFGLAKLLEAPSGDDAATATVGEHLTEEGAVLGTVAYMSPEQAEAKTLDHRTDLFSLGILLYEMATGERPFSGDTRLSVMSAIVRDTPTSITDLNARLPRHLGRIVRKSLEKDISRRYQTALDLRNDLEELKHEIDSGDIQITGTTISDPESLRAFAAPSGRRWPLLVGAAGAAMVALLAWQWGWLRPADAEPVPAFTLTQLTRGAEISLSPTISPDGSVVVFTRLDPSAGEATILQQGIGDSQALALPTDVGPIGGPAFSPDGSQIAFHSFPGGGIFVMGRTGGNVKRLTERGFDPAWSPDGKTIVFSREWTGLSGPFIRNSSPLTLVYVDVASGAETETTIGDAVQPAWSPHGHRIAFWGLDGGQRDIYTAAAYGEASPVAVTRDAFYDYSPVWSPDGRWLYYASTRSGSMGIWRVRIDEETGATLREPQLVTSGGSTEPGTLSISADGRRLVYRELAASSRVDTAAFDPVSLRLASEPTTVWVGARRLADLDLSPDGTWLAFRSLSPQPDIFIVRSDGTEERQVTDDQAIDLKPRWSPDSGRLVFYSNVEKGYQVWVVNPDGSGRMRVSNVNTGVYDPVWSPDGAEIMYYDREPGAAGEFIVRSDAPFDQQSPREVPRFRDLEDQEHVFRASDWSQRTGMIVGLAGVTYSPASGTFNLPKVPRSMLPRWLAGGPRIYYQFAAGLFVQDTNSGEEWPLDVNLDEGAAGGRLTGLALSGDARRIYLLRQEVRSNIWVLEFK